MSLNPQARHRWLAPAIALGLVLVTICVYLPACHHQFLNWDDLTYVTENDHVKGGITWPGVVWAFTQSYSANWHPLTWLSHAVDCQIYSLNPAGHHLTNVLFHASNSVLLFLLLLALQKGQPLSTEAQNSRLKTHDSRLRPGTIWRSAFVASLFALHPLHVESVAWIAERKDVLSGFFFMLTLLAYARYAQERRPSSIFDLPSSLFYVFALLCFALGLMSKPMLVTTPFVLLLLDYWPLGRWESGEGSEKSEKTSHFAIRTSHLLLEKLPFFALSAASCVVTFLAQRQSGAVASLASLPLSARLENAPIAYVEYLLKFFWPINLSPIYPHPDHWAWWQVTGAVVLLFLITFFAFWVSRSTLHAPRSTLTGWLWFLGMLVPVIGIVQVGSQAFADRYTYLPLVGLMIAVAWLIPGPRDYETTRPPDSKLIPLRVGQNSKLRSLSAAVALTFLVLLAWRTSAQLAYWHDTRTLFTHALVLSPNNVQAMYGLGLYFVDGGQIEEGKEMLEGAIRLQPADPEALGALGNLLDGQGNYEGAIRYYQSALKSNPDHPAVLNNLAWLRASCTNAAFRNGPEAVRLATHACELTHYSKPIFIGTLAAAQAEAGDFPTAIATAQRAADQAAALHLDDIAARNRQLIELYRQGKTAR